MTVMTARSPRTRRAAKAGGVPPAKPWSGPEYRVLMLAPTGRDGPLLQAALVEADLEAVNCQDMASLCRLFREGAGTVIVAEEALQPQAVRQLQAAVEAEPTWSDLPLIILTTSRFHKGGSLLTIEQLGSLGNVTVLERPVGRALLLRAVQVALRARARQYDRRRAADALEASLKEKEVLLREIHHRVKNNLQIISSLLSLQADGFKDRVIAGHFHESQARIHSMALVHEKLYGTSNLSSIDMRGYVESLAGHLSRTYGLDHVEIALDVDELTFEIDLAIPCGLILNELLSNGLKYAFPAGRRGRLVIGLKTHGDHDLVLSVQDDGVGLPSGINPASTASLGLRLVDALTRQIAGTLTIDRNQGTRFAIVFPAGGRKVVLPTHK